jgi:hypothetical protein
MSHSHIDNIIEIDFTVFNKHRANPTSAILIIICIDSSFYRGVILLVKTLLRASHLPQYSLVYLLDSLVVRFSQIKYNPPFRLPILLRIISLFSLL